VTDDDLGYTYESWRERWIALGMPWDGEGLHDVPPDWDPVRQLGTLLGDQEEP
jgi:hypothetical protein